jgi:RES domain-containing protein
LTVWRITRQAHAHEPLSGEGARRYGGRWNHAGVPVVYTSEHLSLAVLEYLVNLSVPDLPSDLVFVRIEIPARLPRVKIDVSELPRYWRSFPARESLKDIGADRLRRRATPLLVVPSVVIPSEHNVLINPDHPLTRRIDDISIERFALDDRLLATKRVK